MHCIGRVRAYIYPFCRQSKYLKPVRGLSSISDNVKQVKVDIGVGKLVKGDFNERGYFRPARHSYLHELIRTDGLKLVLAASTDYSEMLKNKAFFVRHQKVVINDNITSDIVSQPIQVQYNIPHLGTSSIMCSTEIILEKYQKPISMCFSQVICVDMKTRRPTPMPEPIKKTFAYAANKTKPKMVELLEEPQSTEQNIFRKRVFVGEEDVDANKHMNQAEYVKFCINVARDAVADQMFPQLTTDIVDCRLGSFSCEYLGETLKGDGVDYSMWQDLENQFLFHFEAKKENNVVYRCHLEFSVK